MSTSIKYVINVQLVVYVFLLQFCIVISKWDMSHLDDEAHSLTRHLTIINHM